MASIAPMLSTLGYDPNGNPPEYGKPDAFVMNKMREISRNKNKWLQKEKEFLELRESIRKDLMTQRLSVSSREYNNENDVGPSSGD